MQPQTSSNKTLITIMIIIGIIIVILLLSPRYGYTGNTQYTYNKGSQLTASVVPFETNTYNTSDTTPGHYTRTVSYPKAPVYSDQNAYVYYPPDTTTYTSYQTPDNYQYPYGYTQYYPQQTNAYYTNGCTPYANYSVTTGMPCR